MKNNARATSQPLTLRQLYPQLTDEELKEAEENLDRYVALTLRIYERICEDPEAYAEFKRLTSRPRDDSMIR